MFHTVLHHGWRSEHDAETERLLSQGREEIMDGHDLNFVPMLGDSVGFMSKHEVRAWHAWRKGAIWA